MRALASIRNWLGTHFHRLFKVFRGIGREVGSAARQGFGKIGELFLQHDVKILEPVETVFEVGEVEAVLGGGCCVRDLAAPGLGRGGVEAACGEGGVERGGEATPCAGDGVAQVAVPGAVLDAALVELAQVGD